MSRLRVIQVELDDASDENIRQVLRGLWDQDPGMVRVDSRLLPNAPRELPEAPPDPETPDEAARPPEKRRKKPGPAAGEVRAPREGSWAEKILVALQKKPMSSQELIAAFGCESPNVYQPCSDLKKKGLIETRDGEDGIRRWQLL